MTQPKVDNKWVEEHSEDNLHMSYIKWIAIARLFHDTYEKLAPKFGYETREDTKEFDPNSKNGKLMVEVCKTVLTQTQQETLEVVKRGISEEAGYLGGLFTTEPMQKIDTTTGKVISPTPYEVGQAIYRKVINIVLRMDSPIIVSEDKQFIVVDKAKIELLFKTIKMKREKV